MNPSFRQTSFLLRPTYFVWLCILSGFVFSSTRRSPRHLFRLLLELLCLEFLLSLKNDKFFTLKFLKRVLLWLGKPLDCCDWGNYRVVAWNLRVIVWNLQYYIVVKMKVNWCCMRMRRKRSEIKEIIVLRHCITVFGEFLDSIFESLKEMIVVC